MVQYFSYAKEVFVDGDINGCKLYESLLGAAVKERLTICSIPAFPK